MSGTLTSLAEAVLASHVDEIDGKVLTRPALLVSDGSSLAYGCDVDIGQKQINENTADEEIVPLRNVAIALGNAEIRYADVGSAVRLRRSESGRWEIVGFSKRVPGTYSRVSVTIPNLGSGAVQYDIGTPVEIGLSSRLLTYEELSTLSTYGVVPYGAIGVFRGSTLEEIR